MITLQDIIDEITLQLQTLFGSDINTDPSEPVGEFIGILSAALFELYQLSDAVKTQFDLSKAIGVELDILAKLLLATRQQATPTTLTNVLLNGTAGTVISAGSKIGYTNANINSDVYSLNSDVTIPTGQTQVIGTFSNDIDGARQVDTGQSFSILTQVSGWTSVDVSSATTTVGEDYEIDSAFRVALQFQSAKNGSNLVDSLAGALLAMISVSKAKVYEYKTDTDNPTPATSGFTPGYFEPIVRIVTVLPIQDVYDEVAQLIWANKPPGITSESEQPTGALNVEGTATDVEGVDHTINFSIADTEEFEVAITIKAATGQQFNAAFAETAIKDGILDYVNGLNIAATAVYSQAFVIIAGAESGYSIQSFTWNKTGESAVSADIEIGSRAAANLQESNITITLVS